MIKIAVIGAGSVVFTKNLVNDILTYPNLKNNVEISLMDIDKDRLDTAYGLVVKLIKQQNSDAIVNKTMNRKKALKGTDFVINTIQVGRLESTLYDFNIPEKYGLEQTIADTHGIGGVFRAVRTIPEVLKIARDMEKYSNKDAILLNYSNPMAMVTKAIFDNSNVNVIGLCHSIQETARNIADYIGVDYSELQYTVGGINHIDWFTELKVNGEDAYPLLKEAMENPDIYKKDKVRFEVMKLFGYFVSESSEHMAEYLPYFIRDEQKKEELDIPIREYIHRCEKHEKIYEENKKIAHGEKEITELDRTTEYASRIINAIVSGEHTTVHGNVKNNGLITNLPDNCCVELPVLVNNDGLHPTYFGDLPLQLAAINRLHINVQNLAVKGIIEKKKNYIYQAVLLDPLVNALLKLDDIINMVDEFFEVYYEYTKDYKNNFHYN